MKQVNIVCDGSSLGKIKFGSNTSQHYREQIEAPWFAYWLKDKGSLGISEAITFQTGANVWKSYDQWPPKDITSDRKLYLLPGGIAGGFSQVRTWVTNRGRRETRQ